MATIKIYLDDRAARKKNVKATVKINISHRNTSSLWNLNIHVYPSQWKPNEKKLRWVVDNPDAETYNNMIRERYSRLLRYIGELSPEKLSRMNAADIRDEIDAIYNGKEITDTSLVEPFFKQYANDRKAQNTKNGYLCTLATLQEYDEKFSRRIWEDITIKYIKDYHKWMEKKQLSVNTIHKYMQHFHAVINGAIDEEYTVHDPFRKYEFKTEETMKRSLTVNDLRTLFAFCPIDPIQAKALNIFKLIFYLIGINTIDLFKLTKISSDGRIVYRRSKTGKIYNIKLEKEALYIINKYKGKKCLVDMSDIGSTIYTLSTNLIKTLKTVSELAGIPTITPYWSRHSWATAAAELDIPKTTIAAALGHGSKTVTDVYIDYDLRKIDTANRLVMDWILYRKFKPWTKAMEEISTQIEKEKASGAEVITINDVG